MNIRISRPLASMFQLTVINALVLNMLFTPFNAAANEINVADEASSITPIASPQAVITHDADIPPVPAAYTPLRYTERYADLAQASNSGDYFDRLKYIPLDANNPASYLSLGGEIRERYEHFHNQNFGIAGSGNDRYGLQRVMLHADLHPNERLRFFVQGISSLQFGGEQKLAVNQNPLDLQQAFVDYTFGDPTPNGNRQTIRAGRFSMTYGSGRLIATRAGPNTQLKFDGLQFIHSNQGNQKLYAFVARPVKEERYEADKANQAQSFSGVYSSFPLNRALGSADIYYLNYRNEAASYAGAAGTENRHTVGVRWFGKNGPWDFDWEGVAQFGEVGSQNIQAWTIATDSGYTFKHWQWQPRLGLKADIASGDRHKNDGKLQTFNPLFFKANYFNDAAFFRPANLADLHLTLQMQPREDLTITLGSDSIWRHTKQDALYGTAGNVLLPAATTSRYVGTTAEAAAQWKINRHVSVTASYIHMYTGNQVKQAGGGDIDYLASWVSFIW
jgi:hypothetical protein